MKSKAIFYRTGHAFFGKGVADNGYVGNVDIIANAVTITIVKPDVDLEAVKRSLEITLQDVELRISQEEKSRASVNSV